jgi:hypothetical protein
MCAGTRLTAPFRHIDSMFEIASDQVDPVGGDLDVIDFR